MCLNFAVKYIDRGCTVAEVTFLHVCVVGFDSTHLKGASSMSAEENKVANRRFYEEAINQYNGPKNLDTERG